MKFVNIYS